MKLTKAIIAVAGYGTRRLPITKTIEKCMLPVGNRPVVDYLVQDCEANDITDVIFVVGEQHAQIKQYYTGANLQLEDFLRVNNKKEALDKLQSITRKANFRFVVQDRSQPYGTAVPLALCADLIEPDEQVLYLAGDDFVYTQGGDSAISQLLKGVASSGATSGLLGVEVSHEDVNKYGVIELKDDAFVKIVEKPSAKEAPSNLINISKYIFDKAMVEHAKTVLKQPAENGECQITDALNLYAQEGKKTIVVRTKGEYLDGGSTQGWLHANNVICK